MASDRMMEALMLVAVLVAAMAVAGRAQQQPPACAAQLVPCAQYLNSSSPPESCCGPLKKAVNTELDCLCSIFNNTALLNTFGIDPNQALQLPKHCGFSTDISICGKSGHGGGSSAAPPHSTTPPATAGADNKSAAPKQLALMGMSGLLSLVLLCWSIMA